MMIVAHLKYQARLRSIVSLVNVSTINEGPLGFKTGIASAEFQYMIVTKSLHQQPRNSPLNPRIMQNSPV